MRQLFGSLACGAVLLAGVAACSEEPKTAPAAEESKAQAPADPVALLKLGIEQGQAGKLDEAKGTFERVLTIEDRNKFAWFNLGYIAQSRNQVEDAVTNYDKALDVDGTFKPALYNKAVLLEATDVDGAVALYRKILGIDDKASTAHLRLGLLLVGQGDKEAAKREFRSAVALDASLSRAVPAEFRPGRSEKTGR